MNPALGRLVAYPFERLAQLKAPLTPPAGLRHIALSIGEPKHAPPEFVVQTLKQSMGELGSYPATRGLDETRSAAARCSGRRCFGAAASSPLSPPPARRRRRMMRVR